MGVIKSIPQGMNWKMFREKYVKHFPISNEEKRLKVMGEHYTRLTGKLPVDEKPKRRKSSFE